MGLVFATVCPNVYIPHQIPLLPRCVNALILMGCSSLPRYYPYTAAPGKNASFEGTAKHFNLRLNRKLEPGDAGFLPVGFKICDSLSDGANCDERRFQVLVDVPVAKRRKAAVSTGALSAILLIIILGIRE